jgi:hypothetical protein
MTHQLMCDAIMIVMCHLIDTANITQYILISILLSRALLSFTDRPTGQPDFRMPKDLLVVSYTTLFAILVFLVLSTILFASFVIIVDQ